MEPSGLGCEAFHARRSTSIRTMHAGWMAGLQALFLTDMPGTSMSLRPTRLNILAALRKMAYNAKPGAHAATLRHALQRSSEQEAWIPCFLVISFELPHLQGCRMP